MATDRSDQHWLETYKSLITLSIEAFKFAALANGGAAVALLAYIGNVAAKCGNPPDMRRAMASFLAGLCALGFSMLCSYLTQLKLLNESNATQKPKLSHRWLLWSGIVLFVTSLVMFGVGSWQAIVGFK